MVAYLKSVKQRLISITGTHGPDTPQPRRHPL